MAACFQWALVTKELRNGSRAMPSAHPPRGDAAVAASARDGSFLTRCWREMDSNHRSLARKSRSWWGRRLTGDRNGIPQKVASLTGYRWFESISLQRRVCANPVVTRMQSARS